jgi:hypothetical protein
MKKSQKIRLKLNRETVRTLASPELAMAAAGGTVGCGVITIYISCGGTCVTCGVTCVTCPTGCGGSCSGTTQTC